MVDEQRVALVTGASTGIGRATATRLGGLGVAVALNYPDESELANVAAAVAAIEEAGGRALAVRADVTDDAAVRAMVEETATKLGRIDYLVNNAGMTHFVDHADLEALTGEKWMEIFQVNVVGAFQVTRAAAPHLRATGAGAVVSVASVSGYTGGGSSIAYAASKAALITMTRSLARVLGPEIRVNAVAPGFVDTGWWQARTNYEELGPAAAARTPLGFAAGPEEIADSIVALLVHNRFVTAQTLTVDGGSRP
jgi:3-oxoacyl-[acyl-carrier protein] reductase